MRAGGQVHFLPRPDARGNVVSARHPTSAALVDAFNLHASDLLHQVLHQPPHVNFFGL